MLRGLAGGGGGLCVLRRVLVRAGGEEDLLPAQPVEARKGIRRQRAVAGADVRDVVDVVNRGRQVVACGHNQRRRPRVKTKRMVLPKRVSQEAR